VPQFSLFESQAEHALTNRFNGAPAVIGMQLAELWGG